MRVCFVTVPFEGHLNVILNFADCFVNKGNNVEIVVVGWESTYKDIEKLRLFDHSVILTHLVPIGVCSGRFTLPRACELSDQVIDYCKERCFDLIVYDFLAVEGYIAAR